MNGFDREKAITDMMEGTPPDVALESASDERDYLAEAVFDSGDLKGTPDPRCVADYLSGIENPTRADIEAALDHCSR